MYIVNRCLHPTYGSVIEVIRSENGNLMTPQLALQYACKERRLWQEEGIKKVRYLVDEQVLTPSKLDRWFNNEYKCLPKCEACAKILNEEIYTHQLSSNGRFCSQDCADKEYIEECEKIKDEEEIDYL